MLTASIAAAILAGRAMAQASPPYRADQGVMVGDGGMEGALRPGQPDVLTPAPRPGRSDDGFAAAYRQAGAPRLMIFWNRVLTDAVNSDTVEYVRRREAAAVGSVGPVIAGAGESVTLTGTTSADPGARAARHGEAQDFEVERAFADTLAGAGVRLVDRTAAMRRAGADMNVAPGDNLQTLETKALERATDLIAEISWVDDDRKSAGGSYRVLVRALRNDRVLTAFTTSARTRATHSNPFVIGADGRLTRALPPGERMEDQDEPAERPEPYVAGRDGGFVRAAPRRQRPRDIGAQLAHETMNRLAAHF